jgi:hypothetical protein
VVGAADGDAVDAVGAMEQNGAKRSTQSCALIARLLMHRRRHSSGQTCCTAGKKLHGESSYSTVCPLPTSTQSPSDSSDVTVEQLRSRATATQLTGSDRVQSGVGTAVGTAVGAPVGNAVGSSVGTAFGAWVGGWVGVADGVMVGTAVGRAAGAAVGAVVGDIDGTSVGASVGAAVGRPARVQNRQRPLDDMFTVHSPHGWQ